MKVTADTNVLVRALVLMAIPVPAEPLVVSSWLRLTGRRHGCCLPLVSR